MVLESVVADLLNRFLGDYVENLDKSQLKLGIWGGNVALDSLQIKENALSELDVPFKVKAGQIDKLTLKIPWKNLYGEAVVATLEGLYLLVVPGASIKYDAGKEEKYLQEIKQRDLSRIEEALQKAAEKDRPKKEKKDTFLEKLATQVIKNVQVKITDIHIKYEDDVTDPKRPLSLGVTLGELSLLTANENWTPCILNEAAKIIYKLVRLDSLSAYWNVNCSTCYRGSKEQILDHLKSGIPSSSSNSGSPNYQYIFRPVSASAKLYINPHAETELKTPKLDCNIEVQNIAIELTKPQYLSMIDLLESVDYMVRNAPYRKYRPYLPLHTNGRQWWKYAIDAILEVHIRRYTRMWSWNNIKRHRQFLKRYKNAYKNKLTQSKITEEVQNEIQDLEKTLDVFNIVLARQQAQVEVIRSGQKLRKKSTDTGEKRSGGWFSGFWGKKETKKKDDEESLVPETIDDLMTPEEKAKLFTAIGYSDSTHNLTLPKQYIAHVMTLKLLSTSITIREYRNVPEILKVQIIGLSTRASQRPGAQALRVEAKLEHWYVTGLMQQNVVPSLVASIGDTSSSLLKVEFETNPVDSTADQTLVVQSQPIEIIYDAKTINAVVEFFQASKSLDLEQITSATLMKLEEIKEKTATGLTHIIETRKVLDLRINLKPSYLIVPRTGFHHENSDILILDFGTFQLTSIGQGERKTTTSSLEEIMDKAYDKFDVEIKSVQCLFGRSGEDWKKARFQHPSSLHILQPMDIHVELAKAMVEKDIRMARFKVSGGLPLMHVRLSDQKMKNVLDLVHSIPLPTRSNVPSPERKVAAIPIISDGTKRLLTTSLLLEEVESESDDEYFDAEDGAQQTDRSVKGSEISKVTEPPNEELIDLQLKFEIKEVILELTKQQEKEETILVFNIIQLGTEATVRPFDMVVVSYLKKISLDYHEIQGTRKKPLHLISSSDKSGLDLLKVEYIKADKNGPSFQTTFENTEQTFKVAFSSLNLLLQTQALLSSISYLTTVIPSEGQTIAERESQLHSEKQLKNINLKKVTAPSKGNDIFNFKLFAKLNAFCVTVCDEKHNIAEIKIQGLDSSLSLQSKKQSLFARLENIIVTDVDADTVHKQAVSIMGSEVFRFNLDLYPDATEGDAYSDMSKVDSVVSLNVGCIQIVYLHKFLISFLNFLNNFHMAKEALSAATAQAAEKAATSVKDLAQRSFRVSISIDLKAPVIVIPQSSISSNAVVVDLGLIRIKNKFSQVSGEGCLLPPVIDKMVVQLTELKLSRTVIEPGVSHPDIQLLHPINLNILVNRNLAAAWYHKIPIMEITGHLDTMNVGLNQDDLSLLLRVLEENLGEASAGPGKIEPRIQEKSKIKEPFEKFTSQQGLHMSQEILPIGVDEIVPEDVTNVLLKFEIKEVLVTLVKKSEKNPKPLHELNVLQLGVEARVKTHDMTAKMYLKKVNMKSHDFTDSKGEPLYIINSCNVTDEPLLKMEFTKADSDGPEFKTVHNNTKQTVKVSFSSLDLVLHLESLLSIMDFMSSAVPSHGLPSNQKGYELKLPIEEAKSTAVKAVSDTVSHQDVFDLKVTAELNAFNIFICDQKCNIADIRVQGMDASISVQSKETEVFARLKDIIVTNADPVSIHKKAVSIVGDEVFRFQMILYPDATEGKAYTDMSKVDGKLSLKVGCIQIVYLHKFFMSLLSFLNNFQKAKEAVSTATAQAAEKAASSVKDFAQKSFRLSMDINLKAPVIIIPQSSVSSNAVLADLGLIRVENKFNLVPMELRSLPPVIDKMDIQLTQLKLSRTILQVGSPIPDIEILQPVNMCWSIQRNLAAEWYTQIPGMKIKGNLKPMQIALSEEDLTILMKILMENLGEGSLQPSSIQPVPQEGTRVKMGKSQDDSDHVRVSDTISHQDVFDLKVTAELNAFNIFICDQKCNIADIRVQGMDASISVQSKETEVFARLKDIIVTNADPVSIHKKAVSIVGDEVFRFQMILYPDATEGKAYTDMSKVDGKLSLKVGCIQIVYLHKFFMSLLSFLNNFQKAKEAVSTATAQAAEKAASSVKDFAQKSFRLSMDINLKAPVIIIPQSSVSSNAVLADLGLIRVENKFNLVPMELRSLPPVIDKMDIQLTQLKLSRTVLQVGSPIPDIEILQPVNMCWSIQRNLAAEWYTQIPGMKIKGNLKPMQIALSEEDLTILMKILMENLGEGSLQPSSIQPVPQEGTRVKMGKSQDDSDHVRGSVLHTPEQDMTDLKSSDNQNVTLQFDFHFESLSLVLYNNDINQGSTLSFHSDYLRLGELRLHLMTSAGKMFKDGSSNICLKLQTCTLDDLREGVEKVTSRMIDKKNGQDESSMIDINYKQDRNGSQIDAVLDKLFICASVEFLMTVADFFIKAVPQSSTAANEKTTQISLRQTTSAKIKPERESSGRPNMTLKAKITDPEVVFVASLAKADAPALTASFKCDLFLSSSKLEQKMIASVKDLKVLACPFLREKGTKNVTTVLQPCSLLMEKHEHVSGEQNIDILVEEFIIKVSPIILNTVMTIMAAMSQKKIDDDSKSTSDSTENLWAIKSIDDCNAWFLGVDMAAEVTETFRDLEQPLIKENFVMIVKSVQVTFECGLGHRTIPLLLIESTFSGTFKNWSSLMAATADMTLEVHYYNEIHAVWEPLIERVEGNRQWNLKLELRNNPVQDKSLMPGDDFIFLPEPQTAIHISSRDTMNITISKCCLTVFNNLSKAFSEGTASTFDYSLKDRAPFTVKNAIGVPIKVQPNSNLRAVGSSVTGDIYDVDVDQILELEYSTSEPLHRGKLSVLSRQESSLFTLTFVPYGYTEIASIPITRPGRRLYNVRNPCMNFSDSALVQIDATEGNKVITLRSSLQIKNHFSIPFTIYKFVKTAKLLEPIGTAKPEEEFHVPLDSYRCQLFIQPAGILKGQFKESTTCISWKEELHRSNEVRCILQCPSIEINFLPLIVNTVAVPDELSYISTHGEDWDPAYIIHLYPSLVLRNLLPYSLRYLLEGTADTHELSEGSTADVLYSRINGEIMELVLMKYQGKNWNGHFRIQNALPEFFLVCFTSDSAEVMTVDLSIHVRRIGSRMILSVFSPYWLINKTSRVLQYRAEDIHVKHPADYRDIILFSFKKKNIFSKNKVQLRISTSAWSSSFSLDTVGSYGCVKCPANNMEYLVGVSIKMSSFNLTRIVTLTPFFTIANKSSMELEVGEIALDGSLPTNKWNYVASSECLPFWPENLSGKLCVRVVGCEGSSKPFFYNQQDNGTLLSLEELNGSILVDVNIAEHSTVITFSDYHEGSAPALIINHTSWDILQYKQSGLHEEMVLLPRQVRLFAWADPTSTKKLTWRYAENVGEHDLLKDECGQFPYDANIQIHWVSFLDGRQRVLLFTDDVALVSKARQAEEMEQADQEINVSLHSLGLSLVNNENKQEISYIGITSSGVVWEMKPKRKWKPFSQKQIIILEQAYQKYLRSNEHEWIKLDGNLEVNFSKSPMEMRVPIRCSIKRDFLSGIHVEFKQSPHQRSLRAQLYWIQVDNQLPGSMFPVAFHPVAPPKSIALDSEPRPFIDISIITRFNEYSKVLQFKYFMVLIQEMALKIDQGFLGAILAFFTPATDPEAERRRTKLIQQDIDALNTELMETSMTDISSLSFFEHFHISPIKLHLSLSLGSGGEESDKEKEEMIALHSVNLLLKSIGATLTDVDDLIFKLAYYEVQYQFYKRDQLMWSVVRHYSEQFLKQMYVLVLGLDVLGNPFGLIRGLSEGVEALFYEPFQGAVQGPEEFAEGLVIGVRSLFGHTVGGAAGVVSRITGSVGKGLAAITMDKEYQQKRREEMGRQPKDFGDSLAKGGKGFLRGVVGGVTGIITKPVEGAKKEGAAGFFKGIGKGLVGAVARPTGGIIDMASSTFQGIQRAAESTEDVCSLRPPRLIHEDGIIRPYDRSESEGHDLFENHIKKLDGETYQYHCAIPGWKNANLVVTNRRVLFIKEVEILGHMSTEWQHPFEDFVSPPTVDENLLKISVKDHGLFYKKDNVNQVCLRKVYLQDPTIAMRACNAIEDAQSTRQQQKLVKQSSLKVVRQ